jgi:hypothetical protein
MVVRCRERAPWRSKLNWNPSLRGLQKPENSTRALGTSRKNGTNSKSEPGKVDLYNNLLNKWKA